MEKRVTAVALGGEKQPAPAMADTESTKEPDALEVAIAGAIEVVNHPDLTPAGRVTAALRMVEGMNIHAAHREKVAGLVRELQRVAGELLRSLDYLALKQELAKFTTSILYGGFTQGPPEVSQYDRWLPTAQRLGWGDEFNLLVRMLQAGERIEQLRWDGATTSQREFSRRAVRLSRKESYSPFDDDTFLARNFPPMREPQREAEPVVISSGPAHLIGKVATQ